MSSRINTIFARRISHVNKALRAMRRSIRASDIISSFSIITRKTITRVRRAVRTYNMIPSFLISTRRITASESFVDSEARSYLSVSLITSSISFISISR